MRNTLLVVLVGSLGLLLGFKLTDLLPSDGVIASTLVTPVRTPIEKWAPVEYMPDLPSVVCPIDAPLIVIAGQSNAANSVGQRFAAKHKVYQFFRGKCYPARGPLAGANGNAGSYWPLVGDLLIERGFASSVVFLNLAKGSTKVSQWADPNDLGGYAAARLEGLRPSHILWHQGESDGSTPPAEYAVGLRKVLAGFRAAAPSARIVVAQASSCSGNGPFPITQVQADVADAASRIYQGPNTDVVTGFDDRYDGCHFSGHAAQKVAQMWTEAIVASGGVINAARP